MNQNQALNFTLMNNQDDLQDIRKQVDMFFDNALNQQEQNSLMERVNTDPSYHRVFTQEQMMRQQIKQKIHRPGVSPDLIQTIKDNIRMA